MKRVTVDKHTGPIWLFVFIIAALAFVIFLFGTDFFLMIMASLATISILFGLPYIAAYLWNKFIANEDDYYE